MRFSLAAACCLLAGCHLIDQRDFDPQAGIKPKPRVVAVAAKPPPPPLVTIAFDRPDPDYEPAVTAAVKRALALKPNVAFSIVTLLPPPSTALADQAEAAAAASDLGRQVADAVLAAGADRSQIELSVRVDSGVTTREVRIFVR